MIRPKKPTPVSIFTFLSRTILPLKAIKMLPWIFPTCSQDNRFSASNLKRFAWERTRTFYKLLLVWRSTFASIKFDLSSSDEWLLQQSASLSLARACSYTRKHTCMHARTHTHNLTLSLALSAVQKFEEKLDSKVPVRVPEERKLVASIRSIGLLLIYRWKKLIGKFPWNLCSKPASVGRTPLVAIGSHTTSSLSSVNAAGDCVER